MVSRSELLRHVIGRAAKCHQNKVGQLFARNKRICGNCHEVPNPGGRLNIGVVCNMLDHLAIQLILKLLVLNAVVEKSSPLIIGRELGGFLVSSVCQESCMRGGSDLLQRFIFDDGKRAWDLGLGPYGHVLLQLATTNGNRFLFGKVLGVAQTTKAGQVLKLGSIGIKKLSVELNLEKDNLVAGHFVKPILFLGARNVKVVACLGNRLLEFLLVTL
mmetsp:Transcript_8572/g.15078  ORF Transcript_8572/g.15078 Transcript_8572/m.15078 type:complete len:216 (+) Transcript_8572:229-876(+)